MNPVQTLFLYKFRISTISQKQLYRPRCKFPGAVGMSLQICLCKKFPACLQFVLLETRQQTVKAPYEPSSWRGYLVKILRPIGHTSKIVFRLLPLPALHKSNGLLCLFSSPSLKESNKNTKRTKYDTTQG